MIGIVKKVQELRAQEVPEGRIGIIYKENKYGEELAHSISNCSNIPVYSKRNINILELADWHKKYILLLRYLASELYIPFSGDEMLFEILHFNWFGIPPY
jgi:DNA helicase-2/ATP-dependent DNA helicase PcrA